MRKKNLWWLLVLVICSGVTIGGIQIVTSVRNYLNPPCEDPDVNEPFEIYISRCENAVISDISPNGKYLNVSISWSASG